MNFPGIAHNRSRSIKYFFLWSLVTYPRTLSASPLPQSIANVNSFKATCIFLPPKRPVNPKMVDMSVLHEPSCWCCMSQDLVVFLAQSTLSFRITFSKEGFCLTIWKAGLVTEHHPTTNVCLRYISIFSPNSISTFTYFSVKILNTHLLS